MRTDLLLYVESAEASVQGIAIGPLGMVAHDGTSWGYERIWAEPRRGGFATHTEALAALLARLAELGEPEKSLAVAGFAHTAEEADMG